MRTSIHIVSPSAIAILLEPSPSIHLSRTASSILAAMGKSGIQTFAGSQDKGKGKVKGNGYKLDKCKDEVKAQGKNGKGKGENQGGKWYNAAQAMAAAVLCGRRSEAARLALLYSTEPTHCVGNRGGGCC